MTRIVALPTATTYSAGNWRNTEAFCFVHGDVRSETFTNVLRPASPDLIDALSAIEALEDQADLEHARAALADPAEQPTIGWTQLRQRTL